MKAILKFKAAAVLCVCLSAGTAAWAGSYDDFFAAITRDNRETIESLLQRGFDPNSRNGGGQTGLYLALRSGSLKAADALIQAPALQVDALNANGETALMMAALRGHTAQVRQLLQRGAQINSSGWTALHYAATGPQPDVVTLLLDRGASVDAESPNRTTPLMMAARYGAESSVEALLARGASLSHRNDQGRTAADFARLAGRNALASRLSP